MKTINFTKKMKAIALLAMAMCMTTGTILAAGQNENITYLENVKNIRKISVTGNVELLLMQDAKESLKVYDNYYGKNAMVQLEEDELRIASYGTEKLTIMVNVNNLESITASGFATVRSVNKLSALDLDINLKDCASAAIDAETYNMNIKLQGLAVLALSGDTENQVTMLSGQAKMDTSRFAADFSSSSTYLAEQKMSAGF
ncbi:GIN domain-containing protein [Hufsiella ginkgonis]|uniref:Putative auto-transporter adhesin head GIN domain-containing protein n=1 Tax=Hufsiella ginkgonis TaxID=2695274 RepID=A0A7K1Y0E3_9SPHI|nr:DUF2807 domain-containing protein [Hufsiella ginkgonis]MXV16186.1 hypothetical protein [Hufsiella ginkgonis]